MRICLSCMSEECAHAKNLKSQGCLSAREIEVIRLAADPRTYKEIATAMGWQIRSSCTYLHRIYRKLGFSQGAGCRLELMQWAWRHAELLNLERTNAL